MNTRSPPPRQARLDREQSSHSRSSSFREARNISIAVILGLLVAHTLQSAFGFVMTLASL
jgi:hypothetical protein